MGILRTSTIVEVVSCNNWYLIAAPGILAILKDACSGSEVSFYLCKSNVLIRTTITTELFYGQTFCTLTVLPTELKRDTVKFAVNLLRSALTRILYFD